MSNVLLKNYVSTTLSSDLSSEATSCTVASAFGLPEIVIPGDYFYLTMIRLSDGAVEIVKVTGVSTNTLTITRAQDGTMPVAFFTGDRVELWITAGTINDIREELKAADSVTSAQIAADAVTTAKVQDAAITAPKLASTLDLSAKTITMPTNRMPKIMSDTTGAPDYVGQIGMVSGIAYVAHGLSAGNWTLLDPKTSQAIGSLWASDNTLWPEKGESNLMDFVLVEDHNDSYKKKKLRLAYFTNKASTLYAKTNLEITQTGTSIHVGYAELMLHKVDTWWRYLSTSSGFVIDINSTGLNGIDVGTKSARTYDIYAVANGTGGIGGLLVINGNSPVYPSGYVYSTKIGHAYIRPDGYVRELYTKGNDTFFAEPYMIYTGSVSSAYNEFNLPEGIPFSAKDIFVEAGTSDTTELTLEFCPRPYAICKSLMANYCPNSYSDKTGLRNPISTRVFYGGALSAFNGKFYLRSARVGGAVSTNQGFAITGYSINDIV